MAEIFLARGGSVAGVERYCVLKRILRERADDPQFVQMFIDEARLAAQLRHPNIASVYDIGRLADSYFFTMEYVHGETVRMLLDRASECKRHVPLACVLTIIASAAAGLHHAHERVSSDGRPLGIVHRDVTPSNLMVSYEGNVKILDFGIAKAANRGAETGLGVIKGKIAYLSPEQCRGLPVDRRSDVFSLGIVMWEMLTGARLYRRAGDFKTMGAIVEEPAPPPSSLRAEVRHSVDDIVLRMLAKSPGDRFQTASEVVESIENESMRASTILSTSAVSHLIRDLFGARAEPWLELESGGSESDGATQPFQRLALAPRDGPDDLRHLPLDPVAFDLSALPLLTISTTSNKLLGSETTSEDADTERPLAMQIDTAVIVPRRASSPVVISASPGLSAPLPAVWQLPETHPSAPFSTTWRRFLATFRSQFTKTLIAIMIVVAIAAAVATRLWIRS